MLIMKANPRGIIPPDQVIGRDKLIANLWSVLERQILLKDYYFIQEGRTDNI
ncbi:MAG: hypothetical protein AB4372_29675 [Xenococcus sp. (in: cyanobacteria)]